MQTWPRLDGLLLQLLEHSFTANKGVISWIRNENWGRVRTPSGETNLGLLTPHFRLLHSRARFCLN